MARRRTKIAPEEHLGFAQRGLSATAPDIQRQYLGVLQAFRDRLSDRAMEMFGVPLRTTETEIVARSPKAPDINIGHIFDHNWELLSPIVPMTLIRGLVKRRFLRTVEYETFKNFAPHRSMD